MKAAQPFSHHLPKKQFGKRTLRQCAKSGKEENIVLIEVDFDGYGDVIILDVPETFQEKFRKNKEPLVIDVDDDDGSKNIAGEYDMASDATTSNRFSSASPVRSPNCPNAVEGGLFSGEGSKPVKLSKSKRTYSGTGISKNIYGLYSDSESDDSDCELMENSLGKLREQWEKASFRRKHDTSCGYFNSENKDDPSALNSHVHYSSEEPADEHAERASSESTSNRESNDLKFAEENRFSKQTSNGKVTAELFTRNHGHYHCSSHLENDPGTDQLVHTEPSTTEHSDLPSNDGQNSISSCFSERLAEQSKSSLQGNEAQEACNVISGCHSDNVTKRASNRDVENNLATLRVGEQSAERPIAAPNNSGDSRSTESNSCANNDMIIDRQKIKETDEYKRALEEESASRQQQLQLQAEEAQRLRNRKRAQNMRIMDNERRQRQRLEEVRETRRKGEENLNLKDEVRAQIRVELRLLETMCFDMTSLLRALGIHVNGGSYPSSNEVQAAYKRACLRFHPDRLSSTDLRQQVEAEEKFKLISNMKDKFCQSS